MSKNLAKLDKKYAQRVHAKNRLKERYGIEINRHDYTALCSMIQGNHGIFMEKQSRNRSVWVLRFQQKWLVAVYDKERKQIASFLPPEIIVYDNDYPISVNTKEKDDDQEV